MRLREQLVSSFSNTVPRVEIALVAFSAELSALEEHLARCRDRVEGLITPLRSSEREDILSPLYESERLLRSAERAISRAERATR